MGSVPSEPASFEAYNFILSFPKYFAGQQDKVIAYLVTRRG